MIESLKPYEETKPSGLPWLGDVPQHWELRPLRGLLCQRSERGRPDLPLLTVARERGVFVRNISDQSENHNVIPEDLSNYKVARQGDLIINKMKAWQGSMGIAPCDGIVSPAYFVFGFGIERADYGAALLRSKVYVGEFARISDGVRVGQWDLDMTALRQVPIVAPPAEEQELIVAFLTHLGGQLSQAIEAKRKTIALLNEQKQAIVHQAVTRGLNPSVPLKPSGLPWVGDIPAHWKVVPLFGAFSPNKESNAGMKNSQVLSLSYGRIIVKPLEKLHGLVPESFETYQVIHPGDIVIRTTDLQNDHKSLRVGIAKDDGIITSAYLCLRPTGDVSADFGFRYLQTWDTSKAIYGYGSGLRQSLSFEHFKRMPIPVPPSQEQGSVAEFVDKASSRIDLVTVKLARECELLTEYRIRLTSDIVTGKLDVREAAKSLPDLDDGTSAALDFPSDELDNELEAAGAA